jgi:hypothetical protein
MSYGRQHFMGANISWARTFHGREYFWCVPINYMWANILGMRRYFKMCVRIYFDWKRIFWYAQIFWDVRIHFWLEANILCVNYYFKQAPIFNDFCSKFCPVLIRNKFCLFFAISFALIFAANICVYFQYLFMHVVCAKIFGANVLKPRFKIDVDIMIICSIVIIIISVLTLQVSTTKYPMIADLAK